MAKVFKDISLEELLNICENPSSPDFQAGWFELLRRFQRFVAAIAMQHYQAWDKNRNAIDQSEVVQDIVNTVFLKLFRRDCHALKTFQARHSQRAFCAYLATITTRLTTRKLKIYINPEILHNAFEMVDKPQNDKKTTWQFFDFIVKRLRKRAGKKKVFIERDILLFNLYTLADFTTDMILAQPLFRDLGPRVVDNAVFRNRIKLDENDEIILRELLE